METASHMPLSQDAALVLALAGTAMPFSHSAEDEAERWLRAMRLQGQVGSALQAMGVGEAPLMTSSERRPGRDRLGDDVIDDAARLAEGYARRRGVESVGTADLLFAVLELYGRLFERALYLRGGSREELLERLAASEAGVEA